MSNVIIYWMSVVKMELFICRKKLYDRSDRHSNAFSDSLHLKLR